MSEQENVTPSAQEAVIQQQAEIPPWEQKSEEAAPSEKTTTQTEQPEQTEKRKEKSGYQKRIDELWREREYERTERQKERAEKEKLLDLLAKQHGQTQSSEKPEGAPKLEDFDSYEKYLSAQARWEAKQIYAAERKADQERSQQEQAQRRQTELLQSQQHLAMEYQSRLAKIAEAAEKKFPDFQEVVFADDVHITPLMGEAMIESDKSDDLMYHLCKNRDEAERISKLSPKKQLLELGKLEVSLSKAKSAAPAPIDPLTGRNATSDTLSSNDDMETWIAKRNRQLGRK